MKVKELLQLLKELPGEAHLCIKDGSSISMVEGLSLTEKTNPETGDQIVLLDIGSAIKFEKKAPAKKK